MAASNDIGLDIERAIQTIIERGVSAVNLTIQHTTLPKAQNYAPVRSIFYGSRRARIGVPRVNIAGNPDVATIMAIYRSHQINTPEMYDLWKRSRQKNKRMNVPAAQSNALMVVNKAVSRDVRGSSAMSENLAYTLPPHGQIDAHNNSEVPILSANGDRERYYGDFRLYNQKNRELVPVATVGQIRGGRPQYSEVPTKTANQFLTSRGQWEVASGRAAFTKGDRTTLGGSLKGSIVAVKADPDVREGSVIYGHVRAGSKKVYYARFQEFGTRHNRPHPFLRPALYDSRSVLKRNVIAALSRSLGKNRFKGAF